MSVKTRILQFLRYKTNQDILLAYLLPILLIAIAIFVAIMANMSDGMAYFITGITGLVGAILGTWCAFRAKGMQRSSSIEAYVWNLFWAVLCVLVMVMI